MKWRKMERRPAVPNLLSSGLCLDTPGVHRRCWNCASSAERRPLRSQTVLPVRNCTLPRRSFAGIILVQETVLCQVEGGIGYEAFLPGRDAAFGNGGCGRRGAPFPTDGKCRAGRGSRGAGPVPSCAGQAGGASVRKGQQRGGRFCLRPGAAAEGPAVRGDPGPGRPWDGAGCRSLCRSAGRGGRSRRRGVGGGPGPDGPGGRAGGLRVWIQFSGGDFRCTRPAARLWGRALLFEDLCGPAQRGGVRHRTGVRWGVPGRCDRHLHREKACQCELSCQGVLRRDGGSFRRCAGSPFRGGGNPVLRNGPDVSRLLADCAGPPGQQGRSGQASAGVRQLGHGGGLCDGRQGSPALRSGPAADCGGRAAVSPAGPSRAAGGVCGVGLGETPGGKPAGPAGRLGAVHRLRDGLRLGGPVRAGVPGGVFPLPAALGGGRRRGQLPQPPSGVSGKRGDSPGAYAPSGGNGPPV